MKSGRKLPDWETDLPDVAISGVRGCNNSVLEIPRRADICFGQ